MSTDRQRQTDKQTGRKLEIVEDRPLRYLKDAEGKVRPVQGILELAGDVMRNRWESDLLDCLPFGRRYL